MQLTATVAFRQLDLVYLSERFHMLEWVQEVFPTPRVARSSSLRSRAPENSCKLGCVASVDREDHSPGRRAIPMTAFEGPRISAIMILIVGVRQSPSPREILRKRGVHRET